jgi:ubiquinone/menaquinone biosynthesis C-methylase UbiE
MTAQPEPSPLGSTFSGLSDLLKDGLTGRPFPRTPPSRDHSRILNGIFRKAGPLFMSREASYDEDYYHHNHLRHLNSSYGFIIKWYYRYIAHLCMVLPSKIRPGAKVIDIGCGVGTLVQQLHELHYQPTGVDVNECAIRNSICPGKCHLVSTTASLDYPDKYFDLIVSRECLEHIPETDIDRCILEWDRVGNGCMVHIIATEERGESVTDDPLHVNVKPEQWWVNKFTTFGYKTIRSPMKLFFSPFGSSGYFMMVKLGSIRP